MNDLFTRRIVVRGVLATCVVVVAALLMASLERPKSAAAAPEAAAPEMAPRAATIAARPHLVFRHTGVDRSYSALSLAPLEAGGGGERAAAGMTCERVSFAKGKGICLQADRGVMTTYKAVFFDAAFTPGRTIKLDGAPSRTRISPTGASAPSPCFRARISATEARPSRRARRFSTWPAARC
jgi:hypothetical protein